MKVIGITGGVGCGKSAILKELEQKLNCVVLRADEAAMELEQKGNKCYDELIQLLGTEILMADGQIDRNKMASRVFGNDKLLDEVNNIVHPAVKEYILEKIEAFRQEGHVEYFFLEAALLIECGYNSIVDEMWYIFADKEVRVNRLKESRHYTEQKIESIMNSQLSEDEYRANSDFVVNNSNSLDDSINQILKRVNHER